MRKPTPTPCSLLPAPRSRSLLHAACPNGAKDNRPVDRPGTPFESFSPAIDTVCSSRAIAGEKVAVGRMRGAHGTSHVGSVLVIPSPRPLPHNAPDSAFIVSQWGRGRIPPPTDGCTAACPTHPSPNGAKDNSQGIALGSPSPTPAPPGNMRNHPTPPTLTTQRQPHARQGAPAGRPLPPVDRTDNRQGIRHCATHGERCKASSGTENSWIKRVQGFCTGRPLTAASLRFGGLGSEVILSRDPSGHDVSRRE